MATTLDRTFRRFTGGNGTSGRKGPQGHGKLGTFLGVFTPTVLTILGVIMYLRFGWVVGQVGLFKALFIVALANGITIITSLCLSAIATNSRVGVGGAYFIISRSLGLEIGGSIGLPLFLSQAFSITLYAYGLAESLRFVWPGVPIQLAAFTIILAVGALAFRGAGFALKSQIPIMVLIGLSLLALSSGSLINGSFHNLFAATPPAEESFWAVFAIFFPAVTGIMAGLSMSGDLENPRESIPRGTLLAALTGFAVYLVVPFFLAFAAEPDALRSEPLIWTKVALLGPWLVLPGLWGAIFSSAVGSMLAAPRTLQALAKDRLVPERLAKVSKRNEPVNGLLVALAIALIAVFLGDLNTVAEVVSMFFLTVYGTLNLVAALEVLSGNPSWRPRMKVHWAVSLLGALGCFGVMILINLPATIAALTLELAIWLILKRRIRKESWGDVRRDVYEALIRWALIRLNRLPMTARNWRPHFLVFAGNIERRIDLVRFGALLSENRGVVTVCELVEGSILDLHLDTRQRQQQIDQILRKEGIVAFGEVDIVENIELGMLAVAQANGIAGIESNTVLVGWPDSLERLSIFLKLIRRLKQLDQSLIIGRLRPLPAAREGEPQIIHIWWGGLQRNGDLMLLLSYLLTRNPEWRDASIRILSIASNELMKQQTEKFLLQLLPEIRINADIDVMVKP
uniref:Na-K-Cl cotransporter n=1 Tax=Trichloromonas sp. TaxID=3069249 RepID=UPI003D815A41